MLIIIVLFVAAFCGLVLSFGTTVCGFMLTAVGSFERISLFSLVGTALLVLYWVFCYFRLYSRVNKTYDEYEEEEAEEPEEEEEGKHKIGRKALVIGVILTILWVALFATTDLSASAAERFMEWQASNQSVLEICKKIGHLLLAFSGGILVSMLYFYKSHNKSQKGDSKEKK